MNISIITTVKNGSNFILETLQSINNQTYRLFEHIIVDDGSTDNTIEILENYKQKNPEYNLSIYNPGPLGRGKALNYAIAKAKYDWIAIIDADDIWHQNKLLIQVDILKKNNEICVLCTNTKLFKNEVQLNEVQLNEVQLNENYRIINPVELLYKNIISHSSVIIKKEFANYDTKRTSQYDFELWLRLGFKEKQKIAILDKYLNFHRIHENQNFESKGGNSYKYKSFVLIKQYCLRYNKYLPLIYNIIKLFITIVIPRKIRFNNVE